MLLPWLTTNSLRARICLISVSLVSFCATLIKYMFFRITLFVTFAIQLFLTSACPTVFLRHRNPNNYFHMKYPVKIISAQRNLRITRAVYNKISSIIKTSWIIKRLENWDSCPVMFFLLCVMALKHRPLQSHLAKEWWRMRCGYIEGCCGCLGQKCLQISSFFRGCRTIKKDKEVLTNVKTKKLQTSVTLWVLQVDIMSCRLFQNEKY